MIGFSRRLRRLKVGDTYKEEKIARPKAIR